MEFIWRMGTRQCSRPSLRARGASHETNLTVRVGPVGDGGGGTARAKVVKVSRALATSSELVGGYSAIGTDTFDFVVFTTNDDTWLVTWRVDAIHGWGQNLCVTFSSQTQFQRFGLREAKLRGPVQTEHGRVHIGSSPNASTKRIALQADVASTLTNASFVYARFPTAPGAFEVRFDVPEDDVRQSQHIVVKNLSFASWDTDDLMLEFIAAGEDLKLDETGDWIFVQSLGRAQLAEIEHQEATGFFASWTRVTPSTESVVVSRWSDPERTLLPEMEPLLQSCAVQRVLLSHDPIQAAMKLINSAPDTIGHSQASQNFTNSVRLCLQRMQSPLGPRFRTFARAVEIYGDLADDTQLQETRHVMMRSSEMCLARQLQCFNEVIAGTAHLIEQRQQRHGSQGTVTAASPSADSDDVGVLRAKVLEKIFEIKSLALRRVFITPAEKYYEYTYDNAVIDVGVHGSNVYRAMLLALLGIVADSPPVLADGYKAAPNFFAAPWFCDYLEPFWNRKPGFKWPSQINYRDTWPRPSRFDVGPTTFSMGNEMLAPQATDLREQALPYLEQYVSELSWDTLKLPLVNFIIQDTALAHRVERIFSAPSVHAFFYTIDDDDVTNVELHDENIRRLFVDMLGVLKR
ncbi:Hypothetical Protein FCC1311_013142 [Hondaea fermentalgiana]|uniref:Uncharacterized protein n=1 Tax=Hondaea fermentalgiana TaxID=2315210 RepID=A0A2R5G245_9STRA|nr:Hypothetical Protein FCC1311_013142 [Hondaea fermentalgiana]|eukprot:GBG25097.1 Hypothetical Protein FCC1311_013142 [Hondaea fermentalgiana]